MAVSLLAAITVGCATKDDNASMSEGERLNQLVESHFDASLERNPLIATFTGDHRFNNQLANTISPEFIELERQANREYLAELRNIDAGALSGQDRLTYDVAVLDTEWSIEGEEFPIELVPLNQMFGFHNFMAQLGSGRSAQPFNTVEDYENWLGRVNDFTVWMEQAETNFREGMRRDVTLPKVLVVKVIPQLASQVVEKPEDSIFYAPISKLHDELPEGFTEADRERLDAQYRNAIENQLIPAYRRLRDFMQDEYLPNARDTHGLAGLPNGEALYEYMIKQNTTTEMAAEEIHQLGLSEVQRIRNEMKKVMREVGFDGTLEEWFEYVRSDDRFYFDSEEELLQAYRDVEDRMWQAVPKLFDIQPKAGFEIRPVEAFRAASSAGASYMSPAPDGSRPGIFYINTHDLKSQPEFIKETLFIHEAIPGHHFQRALQQEVEGLPRFRRFGGYTAYTEGWALYAESLGKELGFFTDPMQWYGRLADEQLRAMRLVVDTGLHAKGWTREQAMEFMLANSSMSENDVTAEVERYMAIPGQALSYKIGQFRIQELRERATEKLGEDFDIREFHTEILVDGPLPLAVLERKIDRWIASKQ